MIAIDKIQPAVVQNNLKYKLSHNKSRNNNHNNIIGCICITIVVIIVFFCGIYIGSKVVHDEALNHPLQQSSLFLGIKGTISNDLTKWDTSNIIKSLHLRKVGNKEVSLALDSTSSSSSSSSSLSSDVLSVAVKVNNDHQRMNSPNINTALFGDVDSYMTAPNNLDNDDILITVWIYLNEITNNNDMRTIFSNKKPGCEADNAQYGISMYVNNWQDGDRRLYVEYGTLVSGCTKIDSKESKLSDKRWYHVTIHSNTHIMALYIDGVVVNSIDASESNIHQKQLANPLLVGIYDSNGQWPLDGYISNLVIIHNTESIDKEVDIIVKELSDILSLFDIKTIAYAYYPLNIQLDRNNSNIKDDSSHIIAIDLINNNNGYYNLPSTSSLLSFDGVKIKLVDGIDNHKIITNEMKIENDRLGRERRENIKSGMKHAWEGYKQYAWGKDELKPLTNKGVDNWGGMGVTLVDSLDTLWLMDMKDEYNEAMEWIKTDLTFNKARTVSVFETTIRELGGLLAAYDIAYDKIYLEKAKLLADKLLPAFNTYSGIPTSQVDFETGMKEDGWSGKRIVVQFVICYYFYFYYYYYYYYYYYLSIIEYNDNNNTYLLFSFS